MTMHGYSNWMGQSGIGEKKLRELTIPGTHHSDSVTLTTTWSACKMAGSSFLGGFVTGLLDVFTFGGVNRLVRALAIAQHDSVTEQLAMGVRYFDLRNCYDSSNGVFYTHHTVVGAPSADALKQIAAFMADAEKELVFIEVNYSNGPDQKLIDQVRQYLGPWLYNRPDENVQLADLRLKDIVADGPKVVALYNHGEFEQSHILGQYSSYRDLWSFSREFNDLYEGHTSVGALDGYLNGALGTTDDAKLTKLQYILEWQAGVTSSSLESFESDLPLGLRNFVTSHESSRMNVVFTDFYGKVYQDLMPTVFERNGGQRAMDRITTGQYVPGTGGVIELGVDYYITNQADQGPTVRNITVDPNGTVALRGADPAEPRQRWRLFRNEPAGGVAFYNPASNGYLTFSSLEGGQSPSTAPTRGTDKSGFDIVKSGDTLVIRMTENIRLNFDSKGDARYTLQLWGWNGSGNQRWTFTRCTDPIPVPRTNIGIGQLHTILLSDKDDLALTEGADHSLSLQIANARDTSQQWLLLAGSYSGGRGVRFVNANSRRYLQAGDRSLTTVEQERLDGGCGFWIMGGNSRYAICKTNPNDVVIDVTGGDPGNAGDIVRTWSSNGSGAQRWTLAKV